MLELLLSAVIMTKAAGGGEIRLHDTAEFCGDKYYAELVVDIPETNADPKIVDVGCWTAVPDEEFFSVTWKSTGETNKYPKAGSVRVDSNAYLIWTTGAVTAAILAAIASGDSDYESKPVSP